MKNRTKLLAIIVFCVVCIGLLSAITTPFPHEGLPPLSLRPVKAQGPPLCCAYWYYGYCYQWVECPSEVPEAEEPVRPSDEVDWWGRLGAFDPQTPDIRFDFPLGAVSVPVNVRAYRTELPADVPPPADGTVGAPFYFGTWIRGEDRTVSEFDRPIVINVGYEGSALQRLSRQSLVSLAFPQPLALVTYPAMAIFSPGQSASGHSSYLSPSDEDQLRLSMYNPVTLSWVKLCTRVDPYANKVSAALVFPTPLEEGGNALLAVISDDTPALEQEVDAQGTTTLSIPGGNFRLDVLAGTVEVGTHFEVTRLSKVPPGGLYKLLPTPVDIKACQADYTTPNRIQQVTGFSKPMKVKFDFEADTLSRAGGRADLTIVSLQDRQWVDLEEFGLRVVRGGDTIAVDTSELGTFSMAVR